MSEAAADLAGLLGRVLLAAGAAVLVVATIAVLPSVLGARRRALALRATLLAARRDALAALALLESRRTETAALLRPWRTLLRWARHPLVVAALQWYRRRRAAARRAHP